tara:strand:- start:7978 stop:13818 length:5841 start_codon:yes stop_codon:yes gene_type:complete
MATPNEKLTPSNFINGGKIVVSYDLSAVGYSEVTTKTWLYISSGENLQGLELSAQTELPVGTQLVVKAVYPQPAKNKKDTTPDNEKYFYVTVVSGENKLDQGYVRFDHIKKVSAEFIDQDFVPTSTIVGKVTREIFNKTKFSTTFYSSLKPKRKYTSFSSKVPASKKAPQAVVVDTYKDVKEPFLNVRSQPGTGKGTVVGGIPDGTIVEKLKRSVSQKKWWRIKVLSGKLKDKIGWVHGRWLDNVEDKEQIYEVTNTYKDKNNEKWLAFRLNPGVGTSGGNKLLGKLYDGEKVIRLAKKKNWWRIRVIDGDLAGQVGWSAYSAKGEKFFKLSKEQPEKVGNEAKSFDGELNNGTPLRFLGKSKSSVYYKVKVLAGPASGLSGWVRRIHTRKPPIDSPINEKTKDVELPINESFISLRDEFTVQRIAEVAGSKNANLKDPTEIPAIFNNLRNLGKNKPSKLALTSVSFYNETDKTFDIIQPFYFTPLDKDFIVENSELESMPKDFQRLFIQQEAIKTKLEQIAPIEVPGKNPEQIRELAKTKGITTKDLGEQLLLLGGIEISAAQFLKLNPDALQTFFDSDETRKKIVIIPSLQVVQTPRWGYFTYKIKVADFDAPDTEIVFPDLLDIEAVNFLVDLQEGTFHGTKEIHGFLAEIPSLLDTTSEITIKVKDLDKRLPELARKALDFSKDLQKANKAIYVGKPEDDLEQQKSVLQQVRSIKTFPTFVKSAAVYGEITAEKLKSIETLGLNIKIKKNQDYFDSISAVVVESTQLGENGGPPSFQTPVIIAQQEQEPTEEIFLVHGKLSLLEEEYAEKINEAFSSLIIKDFKSDTDKIGQMLTTQKPDDKRTEAEFVYQESKENALKNYLTYVLAYIIRDGVRERKFDLPNISSNLITNELVNKKLKSVEDYKKLGGPFILGRDSEGTLVSYTPDFSSLLRQIRWVTFNKEGTSARLDYNFLQIKKYSKESNEVIKGYKSEDYCWILSTDSITHGKLRDSKNYSDFFGELYKYPIFYKDYVEGSDPSRDEAKDKEQAGTVTSFGDAFSSLTKKEKDQMLEDLYRKRYQMVEQAFGGSGCIDFVIKSVDTVDDLYDNVMNKANWSLFIAQAIDRFKCELSKVGDDKLSCLADFDVMGTYSNALKAKDLVNPANFKKALEKEAAENPNFPILNLVYDTRIPSLPSIDWYKCLRVFLLSLLQKIIIGLIVNFTRFILASLDVQCKADFSKCEQSALDPSSDDIGPNPAAKGDLASAGMPSPNADKVASELKKVLDIELTAQRVIDFITFLANQMPIAQFKALLNEDTPIHIFNFGKYLAHNYFAPLKFTDEEFRTMMNLISSNYEFEAFIAATLFEQIAPGEGCPPELINGDELAQDIKDTILKRLDEDPKKAGKKPEEEIKASIEKRVSAFCKLLNFSAGAITEINSAPAQLAGFTETTIAGIVSQIITQLRVKPAFDFTLLKNLYTGNIFGDNPTKEDLIRADLSLAFNVLYKNYLLSRVKQDGKPETRNYVKQFNLEPRVFKNNFKSDTPRWEGTKKLLRNDSFEKEFAKDLLDVFTSMTPILSDIHPKWVAQLYDVEDQLPRIPNGSFESMLLGASQELNNPNYFYAWAEELLALIPIVDPRRFPKKYKAFVEENYPNAQDDATGNTLETLESDYTLSVVLDSNGLRYRYHNGNTTLMDLSVGLEEFEVAINDNRSIFTRDLPKLSEPFFVDEEQDYKGMIIKYGDISSNTNTQNPQKKIFNSLVEQNLVELNIYKNPKTMSPNEKKSLELAITDTFDKTYAFLDKKFKDSIEDSNEQVARFFFQPFMRAAALQPPDDKKFEDLDYSDFSEALIKIGNPKAPAALFFERSDNLLSDIFFDGDQTEEVEKIIRKVKANLKTFYKDMTDGKAYDPNVIANAISTTSPDPKSFYEFQKNVSSRISTDMLGEDDYSEWQQKQILTAVKEITDE